MEAASQRDSNLDATAVEARIAVDRTRAEAAPTGAVPIAVGAAVDRVVPVVAAEAVRPVRPAAASG